MIILFGIVYFGVLFSVILVFWELWYFLFLWKKYEGRKIIGWWWIFDCKLEYVS